MKKKPLLKILFIFFVVLLTGSLFAFSLFACDDTDDETGFQPHYIAVLPADFISGGLLLAASPFAVSVELLEPNSASLYLKLHETSPPAAVC